MPEFDDFDRRTLFETALVVALVVGVLVAVLVITTPLGATTIAVIAAIAYVGGVTLTMLLAAG